MCPWNKKGSYEKKQETKVENLQRFSVGIHLLTDLNPLNKEKRTEGINKGTRTRKGRWQLQRGVEEREMEERGEKAEPHVSAEVAPWEADSWRWCLKLLGSRVNRQFESWPQRTGASRICACDLIWSKSVCSCDQVKALSIPSWIQVDLKPNDRWP